MKRLAVFALLAVTGCKPALPTMDELAAKVKYGDPYDVALKNLGRPWQAPDPVWAGRWVYKCSDGRLLVTVDLMYSSRGAPYYGVIRVEQA